MHFASKREQCRTNTSDMDWKARKRERERDVIERDSELCDERLVGLWEAHTKVSPHDYNVFKGL
jgi:hypothetical protein